MSIREELFQLQMIVYVILLEKEKMSKVEGIPLTNKCKFLNHNSLEIIHKI
jgi:hypothetical protein